MAMDRLRRFLKELEYPGIDDMDKDRLCEVVHANNRTEFLKWVVGQLGYGELPQSDEALRTALGSFIYSHGFCTAQEKTKFVDSALDEEFDVLCELKILFSILEYMCVKQRADSKEENKIELEKFTNDDIASFCEGATGLQTKAKVNETARDEKKKGLFDKTTGVVFRLSEEERKRVLIPEVKGGENAGFNYDRFEVALTTFAKLLNGMDPVDNGVAEGNTVDKELSCFKELVNLYSEFSANVESIQQFMQADLSEEKAKPSEACSDLEELQKMSAEVLKSSKEE